MGQALSDLIHAVKERSELLGLIFDPPHCYCPVWSPPASTQRRQRNPAWEAGLQPTVDPVPV